MSDDPLAELDGHRLPKKYIKGGHRLPKKYNKGGHRLPKKCKGLYRKGGYRQETVRISEVGKENFELQKTFWFQFFGDDVQWFIIEVKIIYSLFWK